MQQIRNRHLKTCGFIIVRLRYQESSDKQSCVETSFSNTNDFSNYINPGRQFHDKENPQRLKHFY